MNVKKEHLVYSAYVIFFFLLVFSIVAIPKLAFDMDMGSQYNAFSYACHQKLSRSLCIFKDMASPASGYWISDCTTQTGTFVEFNSDRKQVKAEYGSVVGYKMPVCARDLGIYGGMLFGGIAYPFVRKLNNRTVWPAIWLIIALIPMAIDGTTQLISDLHMVPFAYESTNGLRLLTGSVAGVAAAFYAIPILTNIFAPNKIG